jgi:hypothetical protein
MRNNLRRQDGSGTKRRRQSNVDCEKGETQIKDAIRENGDPRKGNRNDGAIGFLFAEEVARALATAPTRTS